MKTIDELSEQEMSERGYQLAQALRLRKDREYSDRWQTEWGTKTNLGLFRMVARIIQDGE